MELEIQVRQLIIHELEKEAQSGEAEVFLTEDLIPVGEQETALVRRLNHTFLLKEDLLHGSFSTAGDALMPTFYRQLAADSFSADAFLTFSREAMNALRMVLQGVVAAKGGYLVFADYVQGEGRITGIFLVRDAEGIIFRKDRDRGAFTVDSTTYLNTERLAMACRIHAGKYLDGRDRCVELIKHARSQKEISDYFVNWIGLERTETSRDLTTTFLQVVDELPLPVDPETGEILEEDRFRSEVFNFAMASPQKTIHIDAFDQHFYGEEPQARRFLTENQIALDEEFRFDRSVMKQLHHFRVSAEGVAFSFTRDDYRLGKISLEEDTVVIHSPELVEQIRALLER